MKRNAWIGAIVIAAAWLIGYYAVRLFGKGFSAVEAYALIVGWWLSAYAVAKFEVPISSTIPVGSSYFVVFLAAAFLKLDWFYRGTQEADIGSILLIGFLQTAAVVSPVFFNWIVDYLRNAITKKIGHA